MFTHFYRKLAILCFIFIAIACNVNKGKSVRAVSQMKDTLVITGCREKISLKTGSTLEIKLEATQGTGYQWILKEPSPLLQQLAQDMLEYAPSGNRENIPGQASFQILRFKVLNKGRGEILLEYKRSFENQVEKSCQVKIEIE